MPPIDVLSALLGAAGGAILGGLAAWANGFLGAAGEHAWEALKRRHFPERPSEREVASAYSIPGERGDRYAWIPEHNVIDREAAGWKRALHHVDGCPVFIRNRDGVGERRDFLMRRPDNEP